MFQNLYDLSNLTLHGGPGGDSFDFDLNRDYASIETSRHTGLLDDSSRAELILDAENALKSQCFGAFQETDCKTHLLTSLTSRETGERSAAIAGSAGAMTLREECR